MRSANRGWLAAAALLGCLLAGHAWSAAPPAEQRTGALKLYNDGNYKDAFEAYRALAINPNDDPLQVCQDLGMALSALQQLGRQDEIDAFREAVIDVHESNWRLLTAAAESYLNYEHFGYIIAGKFSRGPHRGGGQAVNSFERDRTRALQLLNQAIPLAQQEAKKGQVADFWMTVARLLLSNRGYSDAWRLQYLTNLDELPDYEQGWYGYNRAQGAPVDDEGNPVFHHVPKSWNGAATDGERWRWALSQAVENDPARLNVVRFELANFLHSQFGVQTMANFGRFFEGDDEEQAESGTWALDQLTDDETIARLAIGIKRFKLPAEFNFVAIFRQIADEPATGNAEAALDQLAQIFENRRQYPRAAEYWERSIKEFGPGANDWKRDRLTQITGNWGQFETTLSRAMGEGATVEYRFRNGKHASFEAHEINVSKLLEDVKAYLRSSPRKLDWNKTNIGDIGFRLVQNNETQYIGKRVAAWDLDLKPRPGHFDKRVSVRTPLEQAGAYLLTAKMAGGNTSKIIIWLDDTAIVKKTLEGGIYYYIADAASGAPVPTANVDFFGFRQRHVHGNIYTVDVRNFTETTDADGQLVVKPTEDDQEFQWIVTATTKQGRMAYLGYTHVWSGNYHDAQYNETKVYTITDRPVYRPGQKVQFKFWVRHAQYDQEDKSDFANQTFTVELHNPKGEKVLTKTFTADAYGGIAGEYELLADATLGVYQLLVVSYGGGSFRVEEYKKPEFEVSIDAPTEPVMLGEKIAATIKAKYYFGSPVTQAKVKYKVMRSNYTSRWYPIGRWDWLYGPGYWWFAYDYPWYPGWGRWGCVRPAPSWWIVREQPPELVAEQEVPIAADGTVQVEIDTAVAKLIHPDRDHEYTITAEVVDQSRRTIVGQGTVLVARKPFKVYVWADHGYYRVGDVVRAEFQTQTLDRKPVTGEGVAKLYKIAYRDGKPVETEVRSWEIDPDQGGHAELQLKASEPGQFRLAYTVIDAKGHSIEGAYLLTIIGEGFDASAYRFNDLELVADRREYQPSESVSLMVNTNRSDSHVLLFLRPANGVYMKPKLLRLGGKSAVEQIEVLKKDMPNFFVEAVTIAGGRVFTETREIAVPPETRVIDVAVVPSSQTYKPGQKASVTLKLTDSAGQPFIGSMVAAIYDKAVEYISGGSNVEDIRSFFWRWRRLHRPQTETNLMRMFANLTPEGQAAMASLGIFGDTVADELRDLDGSGGVGGGGASGRGMATRAGGVPMMAAPQAAMAEGAPMDLAMAKSEAPGGGADLVQPTIRTNFADTALWAGSLTTDEQGIVQLSLAMPENLTTWKIRAWGMGHGTKVGQGEADVVTRKNLIVRMQGPRFFVEKDEVVLSANVHNYLSAAKLVTVALELDGPCLAPMTDLSQQVEVPASGEARVDWRVKVVQEGQAVIRMKGLTDEESDAVQQTYPVYVHGILKMESFAGALRPDQASGTISLRVPTERRVEQSRLEVRYTPTLAGAMVDVLPYLVDYPYGCTEQTLNRFLPTVITQRVLIDMGLDLKKIREHRTNLNSQEIGDGAQRTATRQRFGRNPVFDQAEVTAMVKDGVQRLVEMQCSDGGWGWFSGWGEHSYPHTTAIVVHGLQVAKQNDVAVPAGILERGIQWLKEYQDQQVEQLQNALVEPKPKRPFKSAADNLDALVYMVLVDADVQNEDMRESLYRDRTKLAVYSKAMFGLALVKQQQAEQLDMILQNLRQFVVEDEENQTAYLKLPQDNYWWCWYGSETEANAYYLKLLARTDPKGRLASRLVKYLLNNRKHATYWDSTRDTALAIEALADYLKASGEDKPDMTVEVWLDGAKQKEVKITAADLFTFDNKFVLEGDAVKPGEHVIEIRRTGNGPVYYNAYLTNFTLEDYIASAGLEVKVARRYFRLKPVEEHTKVAGGRGQAVGQRVEKYIREELADLATLTSGELVEVELEIDSKNDYEYLMFEDMKPAGFEPVEVRSGYSANGLGAYMELRDNRVTFFVRALARGKHSISYRMRTEVPGQFSALPATAAAMYAPELKGNSSEIKLKVVD